MDKLTGLLIKEGVSKKFALNFEKHNNSVDPIEHAATMHKCKYAFCKSYDIAFDAVLDHDKDTKKNFIKLFQGLGLSKNLSITHAICFEDSGVITFTDE